MEASLPKKPAALGAGPGRKHHISILQLLLAAFSKAFPERDELRQGSLVSRGGKEWSASRSWRPWKVRKVNCFCDPIEQKIVSLLTALLKGLSIKHGIGTKKSGRQ